jgi:hypothetical protein
MNKLINYIWHPNRKTAHGFKYGTYFITAPAMLLIFVIPGLLVLGILFLYFILRLIVTLRAASKLDMDQEKIKTYANNPATQKKGYAVFSSVIIIFLIGIVIFYLNVEGLLGGLLSIFIATIVLPGFFEEIIVIKRCQSEYKPKA